MTFSFLSSDTPQDNHGNANICSGRWHDVKIFAIQLDRFLLVYKSNLSPFLCHALRWTAHDAVQILSVSLLASQLSYPVQCCLCSALASWNWVVPFLVSYYQSTQYPMQCVALDRYTVESLECLCAFMLTLLFVCDSDHSFCPIFLIFGK